QLMAIFLIRQARSMSLDADVLEAVAARRPRQIREVMAQRHFGTGEGKSLPPAFPGVLGEDPSELIVRLGPQPVHRPFDHAMDALQVALEVHRDFHVIVCWKALAGGGHGERNINIGHVTLLPGESPHQKRARARGVTSPHARGFFPQTRKNGESSSISWCRISWNPSPCSCVA